MNTVIKNFVEFFRSLDINRKIALLAIGAIIFTIMISMIIWASKTQYKVLYTDLGKEDSSKIAQMLERGNISYQVKDDGKSIYVPEDQVDIWRLEIAKQGVDFSTTIGYEVFDKQSFGTSSFVQKINKQRALEGELMKTIKHIRGVNRARVHLSIPESSPFVSEQKPPSASVVIDIENGLVLTKEEIRGIQHLVAASIDGMRLKDVVIIDSKGEKLSENVGDPMAQYTANRIALESKVNKRMERQVEDILTRVVGEGKVIAKVNVKMDFTESVETKTIYDGETQLSFQK
jgi:flagellar M-ring protein FliF